MSSCPKEAWVVANVIARQLSLRGGAVHICGIDNIARASPRMYQELLEDAELIIEALDKHREQAPKPPR